ncbi:MAG: twin-arginine translocase TatA/TatE family subunit [Candidatus Brocadiia bacterium]
MSPFIPLAFWSPGPFEMVIIGMVALLLFGPRLPSVMRSIGKGIVEFKKGLRDTEDEISRQIESSDDSDATQKQIEHETED